MINKLVSISVPGRLVVGSHLAQDSFYSQHWFLNKVNTKATSMYAPYTSFFLAFAPSALLYP